MPSSASIVGPPVDQRQQLLVLLQHIFQKVAVLLWFATKCASAYRIGSASAGVSRKELFLLGKKLLMGGLTAKGKEGLAC